MKPLWTAAEVAEATGGVLQAREDWVAAGVSIDSREIATGDLFVALQDVRDGHDFVGDALAKGAVAALVSRVPDGVGATAPLVVVADVQAALEALAARSRDRSRAGVIAVTGSAGKTSTKEMLRTVLSRQGRTHAAERSFNNHWGVPLTLARMPTDSEFAVIEIGMSAAGEIAPLSRLTRPHVAMITSIAPAHMEAFGSLTGIAREKASIIRGLVAPDGKQVVCADVPHEAREVLEAELSGGMPKIWYGTDPAHPWHILEFRQLPDCSVVRARLGNTGEVVFKLSAPGRHFALNALGVLAAVEALGADPIVAAHDLVRWEPPEGRGRRETIVLDAVHDHLTFQLYDDAFNANPASVAAALEVLASAKPVDGIGRVGKGRRVAILGDMLELGDDESRMHADLAKLKSMKKVHRVHCVGARMAALHSALRADRRGEKFDTAERAAARAHALVDAGDVVLVKGSKASRVSLVVDALRKLGHRLELEEEGD